MKKLILIFLTINLFLLPALDNNSFIPNNVSLGMGNDRWTYGLSRNDDDHLTYSFNILIEAPFYFFKTDINSYTNRGWKDAWPNNEDSDPSHFYKGRYDALDSQVGINFNLLDNSYLALSFKPKLGISVFGNIGLQEAQNVWHRFIKIPQVVLPYDGENIVSPYLGAELDFSLKLFDFLHLNLGFESNNYIMFEYSQGLTTKLRFYSQNINYLSLGVEYWFYQNGTTWKTQSLINEWIRGFRFTTNLKLGPLHISYMKALSYTQGSTILFFNIMDFFAPITWKEDDIYFSQGLVKLMGQSYHYIAFEKAIGDSNFAIIETIKYTPGNPPKDRLKNNRLKRMYTSVLLGAKYYLPSAWSKDWVNFFLSASLGFENFNTVVLYNMDPSATLPGEKVCNDYLFLMDVQLGFDLFPDTLLLAQNISINGSILTGCHIYPDYNKLTALVNAGMSKTKAYKAFQPYIGVVLKVGLDL